MAKRMQWLLAFLTAIGGAAILYAQNPVSISQVGTTPVTTTVPVSGTVTAAQGTATNLKAEVVGTGTFATQAAQSGTWTVQPGNTANTTAWKVDGSAVTQPVSGTVTANAGSGTLAVSLASVPSHAVTNAGTFATQSAITAASGAIASGAVASGAVASGAYASDSGSFGVGATAAAPPAKGVFNAGIGSGATGGLLVGVTVCDTPKTVSITSATTTLVITGVSGRHVYICHADMMTGVANNVALISGTGATCGTGTTGIAGGTTAANGWNFAANGGIAMGSGLGFIIRTTSTGDSVCAITSSAGPLAGSITYAIY